jgi:type I restriction enzyme S subunit
MSRLPKNWELTTLGKVAQWGSGGTPNRSNAEYYGGAIPWFKTGELNEGVVTDAEEFLTEEGLRNSSAKLFPKGSLMIAMYGATIGKCAILGVNGSTNQACAVAQPYSGIDPRYLFHYLRSQKQDFIEKGKGGAQPNISQTVIKEHPFPLAPLPEQKRIVTKLDTLFGHLDQLRTRREKIPELIKQFRRAVLSQAATGKLTEDWRSNHSNIDGTEGLLRRIQEMRVNTHIGSPKRRSVKDSSFSPVVDQNDLYPESWRVTRIGDISECLDYIRRPINKDERLTRKGNIPYYGANGQVGWIDDYLFDEDLVVVVEDETFIGREIPFSYIIRGKSWVNNHAHVLRPIGGISVDYLNSCLAYYNFIPMTAGTTGRRKLTQGALLNAPLPIAPLEEQIEIVRKVEALFTVAEQIELSYKTLQEKTEQLPQAILSKAFRGELVAQEIEKELKGFKEKLGEMEAEHNTARTL